MSAGSEDLDTPIQQHVAADIEGAAIVTKWFLVTEVINEQGGRSLIYHWQDDTKTWDVRGMLGEALVDQGNYDLVQLLSDRDE